MDTGFATGMRAVLPIAPPGGGATDDRSGQENRHHGDDEDDGGGAVFHQHDEAFVGLLMGRIIVAVSGRVGHFVMLCHRSPPVNARFSRAITAIPRQGQRRCSELFGGCTFYLPGSRGQLSRIQRVRLSSLTSPAARERMISAAWAGSGAKAMSLLRRKTIIA